MSIENIIIADKEKLEAIKKAIIDDGPGKLHIVSDFDKTLTSCFIDGKKITSLISILRDEHYLTPDYSEKAQALYDKFHPAEINPNISLEQKKSLMHEWWSTHYDLLIKSGLSKSDLIKVSQSEKISLRPGALEFFDFLNANNIPLIILSAAGLGSETITLYLEKFHKKFENIKIVSNSFIWNKEDRVVGVNQPIIHTFNKDYTAIKEFTFFENIKNRKNVILLGDGIGDVSMINGFDYDKIIKIGFLNENSKGELAEYKENYDIIILNDGTMDYILDSFKKVFDVVIPNDGPMDYVNLLLEEICSVIKK